MQSDSINVPSCPNCGAQMKPVRIIPRVGGLPELTVFQCAPCNHVETVERGHGTKIAVAGTVTANRIER